MYSLPQSRMTESDLKAKQQALGAVGHVPGDE